MNMLTSNSILYEGFVFAVMSGAEITFYMVASLSFLPLYPATLYISHWFIWMFTSGLCAFPLVLIV